jgi:transcriptional regulator with XRE-family HTH domain
VNKSNSNRKNIPKPTNFGSNMKFLRKREGLTQGGFAEIVGISRNSIASYENGQVEPNALNFLRVCKYFDQDPKVMLEHNLNLSKGREFLSAEDLQNAVNDSFSDFLTETKEMSKVLEGYQEFYAMRRDIIINDETKDLFVILDDLLALLNSLIVENQKLIDSMDKSHNL